MNFLQILAAQPGVARLGATLLHFLWQGLAIVAIYAMVRRRARASVPDVRYLLGCAAMAAMAAAPLATWWLLGTPANDASATSLAAPVSAAAPGAARSLPEIFPGEVSAAAAAPFLAWIVALWLVGATALWVRLIGGWILAARLGTRLVRPAPPVWQQTLDRLKTRMRVSSPVRLVSSLVQAPAVVGWVRPVVLAPVGMLAGLPAEQMEALLLHELAHIRRYDYLVNMLQSAVEALLFYHPAVWWVSGHMRAERELCCDDAAVSVSGDAVVYARALAGLGSLCPPIAMAANGGSLSHRIGRLLGQPRSAPRTLSGTGIVVAAVLPVIAAVALLGQASSRPRFEVASIRPADYQSPMRMQPRPGRLTATASLKLLMQSAYSVQPFQIEGGPDWADSERYAIEAKTPGNASHDQVSRMLQALLEQRFQLKFHRETRQVPTFNLVIAKGGLKLPAPREGSCMEETEPGGRVQAPGPRSTPAPRCGGIDVMPEAEGVGLRGGKVPMNEFVRVLSRLLGRTVTDHTGFSGLFDIKLTFLPDDATPGLHAPAGTFGADVASPSIFGAVQQLGLRLESAKGPVEVLVIDHVERPSAN